MSIDFPELNALKAGDILAWKDAFQHLWPIALCAAQHPKACLLRWEAWDVAAESINEFIWQIDDINKVEEIKPLILTIAYRRAIELARRKSAAKRTPPDEIDRTCEPSLQAPASYDDVERREMIILLRKVMEVLDPQTQLFLREKFELGLTYEEIRARHNIPLGTICVKVARGLKKIREHLRDSPLLLKELEAYLR